MEQAKLLGMTAVLTVLIWATADSLVSETFTLNILIEVAPMAPGSTMLIEAEESVEVQISGPRKEVEAVRRREARRLRLPIEDRPTGQADITLDRQTLKRRMAEQWPEFKKLSVVSVEPPILPVRIDHMIERDVDITLNRLTLNYADPPRLARTNATVRMRESEFLERARDGRLDAIDIADPLERQLREKVAGRSATISVGLDATVFGPDARITPGTIEVTATISTERSTEEIPTVPILLAVSFANLERPFAALPADGNLPVTRTIRVTGTTAAVARLLRGETRAFGLIHLKEDDLHVWADFRPMTPEYHLPPGVELAEEPEPIEFKLTDDADASLDGVTRSD